jgi:nickel transport protein
LSLLATLGLCGPAKAHRLEAEYRVLPGDKVQVESWFDLTGESPVGAKVTVYRAGGDILTEGKLDEKGLFVFRYTRSEPLRIVIAAGAGHRKEIEIPAARLPEDSQPAVRSGQPLPEGTAPLADRSTRIAVKDVLLGVGLLLAVAAFAMGLANRRRLRELSRKLDDRA